MIVVTWQEPSDNTKSLFTMDFATKKHKIKYYWFTVIYVFIKFTEFVKTYVLAGKYAILGYF